MATSSSVRMVMISVLVVAMISGNCSAFSTSGSSSMRMIALHGFPSRRVAALRKRFHVKPRIKGIYPNPSAAAASQLQGMETKLPSFTNSSATTAVVAKEVLLEGTTTSTPTTGDTTTTKTNPTPQTGSSRLRSAFPSTKLDELDRVILKTAIPNILNYGIIPVVNAVDTFWVGRLGIALALAGQAAANQATYTLYFLIAFLPNITAPLVANAIASGDPDKAQQRVCEALFLCTVLGTIGTLALVFFPRAILSKLVLPASAPAMEYAAPYLKWRALGMVPSLVVSTGYFAYCGLLDTVTPLYVGLATNILNLFLDPLCIFWGQLGFVGAAIATAASEAAGGLAYMKLMFRRNLVRWGRLLTIPSWKSLLPLLKGGAAMLARQLALNVGFLVASRRSQIMDPSGVSGAAYGIVMQVYNIGILILVAMQSTASTLVSARMAACYKKTDSSTQGKTNSLDNDALDGARECADRLLGWTTSLGLLVGFLQAYVAVPLLVPLFSTLPEVQAAAVTPSRIAALLHIVNGPVLAGEGILMGLGRYKQLAMITLAGMITLLTGCLGTPLGKRLDGILWSILISSLVHKVGVLWDIYKVGPLSKKKQEIVA